MLEKEEGDKEEDFNVETRSHRPLPRWTTKLATEGLSKAESSDILGNCFTGTGTRNSIHQLAREGVVLCSLSEEASGGRDAQTDPPISTGSTTGGGSGEQSDIGMEESSKSMTGEVEKAGICSSRVRSPSTDSQGWISVLKRRPGCQETQARRCSRSAPPQVRHGHHMQVSSGRYAERLSLTSPRRASTLDRKPGRPFVNGDLGLQECSHNQIEGCHQDFQPGDEEPKGGEEHWLPERVIECGKAVRVTMEESEGGWDSLTEFVQRRQKQKKDGKKENKSKRKGKREQNGL